MEKPDNSPDDVVYVLGTGEDTRDDGTVFVIEDELRNLDMEVYDRVYATLSYADPDLELPLPMYRITWRHVLAPQRAGLQELVMLYMTLEEVVSREDPRKLVCGEDVRRAYMAVIMDLASEYGLEIEADNRGHVSLFEVLIRFLKNSFLVMPFLFDQLFSLVWGRVTGAMECVEMAFVPSLGRLGSTAPVLDRMAESGYENYSVIITSKVSSQASRWRWRYFRSRLDDHELESLSSFTGFHSILWQVSAYFKVNRKVLFGDELKNGLDEVLVSEFDVHLDHALTYAIYEAFRTRVFLSVFFFELTRALIKKTGCEKVVIGGLSPTRRAIMLSGIEEGARIYYIPHNIGTGETRNPPSQLTHFVSGKLEERRYSESNQVLEPWNWIVTGRPYLVELQNGYGGARDPVLRDVSDEEELTILIATQGYFSRREFVENVLECVQETGNVADIVIKTHPSETVDFYSKYADNREGVIVTDSDLFEHLVQADLTVTMNSNVGLESIIVGTPSVCMNKWWPSVPDPIYAMYGPIPIFRSKDELLGFFEDLDKGCIEELRVDEEEFVHEYFELETDAAQNILDRLLS